MRAFPSQIDASTDQQKSYSAYSPPLLPLLACFILYFPSSSWSALAFAFFLLSLISILPFAFRFSHSLSFPYFHSTFPCAWIWLLLFKSSNYGHEGTLETTQLEAFILHMRKLRSRRLQPSQHHLACIWTQFRKAEALTPAHILFPQWLAELSAPEWQLSSIILTTAPIYWQPTMWYWSSLNMMQVQISASYKSESNNILSHQKFIPLMPFSHQSRMFQCLISETLFMFFPRWEDYPFPRSEYRE